MRLLILILSGLGDHQQLHTSFSLGHVCCFPPMPRRHYSYYNASTNACIIEVQLSLPDQQDPFLYLTIPF